MHSVWMLNEQDARLLAEEALDLDVFVITHVEEHDPGWVFYYDTHQHQRTGDFRDTPLGNSPILVDRTDGSVHFTVTARRQAEYIRRYMERDPDDERSWHP